MHRDRLALVGALGWLAIMMWTACGARSQLDEGRLPAPGVGGSMPTQEAGSAGSPPEQGGGGTEVIDAGPDVPVEGPEDPCADPDATNIYLVTKTMKMYSWHPQSLKLEYRGLLECPADNATPFSMAVTRGGTAYVIYNNGTLWQVDITDASCTATSYQPNQHGIEGFGMGFALNDDGVTERLFIAGTQDSEPNRTLGWIDLDTFTLQLGPKSPPTNNNSLASWSISRALEPLPSWTKRPPCSAR